MVARSGFSRYRPHLHGPIRNRTESDNERYRLPGDDRAVAPIAAGSGNGLPGPGARSLLRPLRRAYARRRSRGPMGRALRPGLGAASLPPAPARDVAPYLEGKREAFDPQGLQEVPACRGRSDPVSEPARFRRQLRSEGKRRPRDLHTPSEPPRAVAGWLFPITEIGRAHV